MPVTRIRILLLLLTVLLLLGEPFLSPTRVMVYPAVDIELWPFASASQLDKVSFEWRDQAAGDFVCRAWGEQSFVSCGITFSLSSDLDKTRDLSGFSAIHILAEYEGDANRLRIAIRDKTPGLTGVNLGATEHKYMRFHIDPKELEREARVQLSEFSVADWWLEQFQVPREHAAPTFSHTTILGLDVFTPGEHRIRLKSVYLEKPRLAREHLLYGIIGFWMLFVCWEGISRYRNLKWIAEQSEFKLDKLAQNYRSLQLAQQRLEQQSIQDSLTGVLNRKGLEDVCARLFPAEGDHGGALLLIDLDHFKEINDKHGHDCGDRVLKNVAHLLRLNTREGDVLARWGGEEFVLLCSGMPLPRAKSLAAKICTLMALTVVDDDLGLIVTASVGVAMVNSGDTFEEVFKRADIALYQAKSTGRNRWCVEQA